VIACSFSEDVFSLDLNLKEDAGLEGEDVGAVDSKKILYIFRS